jgi:hypothetical protein
VRHVRAIEALAIHKDARREVELRRLSKPSKDEAIGLDSTVGAPIGPGIEGEEGLEEGTLARAQVSADDGVHPFSDADACDANEEIPNDQSAARASAGRAALGGAPAPTRSPEREPSASWMASSTSLDVVGAGLILAVGAARRHALQTRAGTASGPPPQRPKGAEHARSAQSRPGGRLAASVAAGRGPDVLAPTCARGPHRRRGRSSTRSPGTETGRVSRRCLAPRREVGVEGSYSGTPLSGLGLLAGGSWFVASMLDAPVPADGPATGIAWQAAMPITQAADRGQLEPSGRRYIDHVCRVASNVPREALGVAWLHDVLERSDVIEEDLVAMGLARHERAALRLLTHRGEEERDDASFLPRVRIIAATLGPAGRIARAVKRADMEDRMRMPRDPGGTWTPPYARALAVMARNKVRG